MGQVLHWDNETAHYVRSRPERYPGGLGIEPKWTQEALRDPNLAAMGPDPKSPDGCLAVHRAITERWARADRHRLP